MLKKIKNTSNVLRFGLIIMFVSLLILVGFLTVKVIKDADLKNNKNKDVGVVKEELTPTVVQSYSWSTYKNDEYGFQVDYPKLLHKVEYKNKGRFLFFERFEENKFSREKGIALGVSRESLEKEAEMIKNELQDQKGKLTKEENIQVGESSAIKLEFQPEGEGEARGVVIINFNDISLSISTVPEQIDRVIGSFKVL